MSIHFKLRLKIFISINKGQRNKTVQIKRKANIWWFMGCKFLTKSKNSLIFFLCVELGKDEDCILFVVDLPFASHSVHRSWPLGAHLSNIVINLKNLNLRHMGRPSKKLHQCGVNFLKFFWFVVFFYFYKGSIFKLINIKKEIKYWPILAVYNSQYNFGEKK